MNEQEDKQQSQNTDEQKVKLHIENQSESIIYRGLTLDNFQKDSIMALQSGHSVLVAAPTGTGKTLVADWIVESAMEQGKAVVYTAPIKALSNQKFRDYCKFCK